MSPECQSQHKKASQEQGVDPRNEETFDSVRTPDAELGNLTEVQRQLAIIMLQEEAELFSKDDEDVGSIEGVPMTLTSSDCTPVQKTCTSLPRPLYTEIKHYIEDLLSRGWITKSQSSHASPAVCIRKKDGGLRLHVCIDYREINRKTVRDHYPISTIQETLDNLGGNS